MSEKTWMGAIYLKDEGGYQIVFKSLHHYKKRLKTLGSSPELKNAAAMFGPLLVQQAAKTIPKIDQITHALINCLENTRDMNIIRSETSFLEKALACYESDIHKARDSGHDYFVNLVGNMRDAEDDLASIKVAQEKINQFI